MTKAIYAIVGMKHRGTEALVASLPAEAPLKLVRQANNPYDHNAIQVWAGDQHVGYISAKQNAKLAARLDSDGLCGGIIAAKLQRVSGGWPMAEVEE